MNLNLVEQELEDYLNQKYKYDDDSLVVLSEDTIERDTYWVFFYTSKRYLETNDPSRMLAGNAPIIVNKLTGEKHITGTAYSIEYYMEEYEKKLV